MLTQTDPSPFDVHACAPEVVLGHVRTAGIVLAIFGLTLVLAGFAATTSRSAQRLAFYLFMPGLLFTGAGFLALILSSMHC